MRPALVDALTFAGMANDNLRLRYYHDVLPLEKYLRAEIPSEFQRVWPHLNHSHLAYINKIATAYEEINFDVQKNVRPLPQDDKEKFMLEYLVEQIERNKRYTTETNGRCTCFVCGGREKGQLNI